MGRFITPDWAANAIAVPYATFGDPQSLNLYAYVENSPIDRVDADGHYVCNGDCSGLEAARKDDLSSSDPSLKSAATALGSLGDNNGVTITTYNDPNSKHLDEAKNAPGTNGYTVKDGKPVQATVASVNTALGPKQAVAHLGTHVANRTAYVSTINPKTGVGDQNKNITLRQDETAAYKAQNAAIREENRENLMNQNTVFGGNPDYKEIHIQDVLSKPPYDPTKLDLPLFPQ